MRFDQIIISTGSYTYINTLNLFAWLFTCCSVNFLYSVQLYTIVQWLIYCVSINCMCVTDIFICAYKQLLCCEYVHLWCTALVVHGSSGDVPVLGIVQRLILHQLLGNVLLCGIVIYKCIRTCVYIYYYRAIYIYIYIAIRSNNSVSYIYT